MTHTQDHQPPVTFTIDGVEYTTEDRRQTASQLIILAGLDPADHDLARVTGDRRIEHRYQDADVVEITPGATFVTVFTGSTPVA